VRQRAKRGGAALYLRRQAKRGGDWGTLSHRPRSFPLRIWTLRELRILALPETSAHPSESLMNKNFIFTGKNRQKVQNIRSEQEYFAGVAGLIYFNRYVLISGMK
jgi:hypothetical protein